MLAWIEIKVFVDGEPIFEAQDQTSTGGKVGLVTAGTSEVYFDGLTIRSEEIEPVSSNSPPQLARNPNPNRTADSIPALSSGMRVAGIRYINALPLIYGLRKRSLGAACDSDAPSVCYRKLIEGEVDVALIPVFGTQINPEIRASKGSASRHSNSTASVYLFATKPLDRVESVVTDPGSISSATLVNIILRGKVQ